MAASILSAGGPSATAARCPATAANKVRARDRRSRCRLFPIPPNPSGASGCLTYVQINQMPSRGPWRARGDRGARRRLRYTRQISSDARGGYLSHRRPSASHRPRDPSD